MVHQGRPQGGSRSLAYTIWKLSTAKGKTMEMQMAFPDVHVTTAGIMSAVRRMLEPARPSGRWQ